MAATNFGPEVLRALTEDQGNAVLALIQQFQTTAIADMDRRIRAELGDKFVEVSNAQAAVATSVGEIRNTMQIMEAARQAAEAVRGDQERYMTGEFAKAQKLADDMGSLDLAMTDLKENLVEQSNTSKTEMLELFKSSRTDLDILVSRVQGEFKKVREEM